MSLRDTLVSVCAALLVAPILVVCVAVSSAQIMQSTNYRIVSDSVNFGGGLSTSTNYTLESTGGEIATGESASASYKLKAGYQQMVTTYIAMTTPAAVTMSPDIPGIAGGTADGSTAVTVTTDSSAGYELTISAGESPALIKGADSIADYVPIGDPDFDFTTDTTDSHFGYSPSGVDVVQRFKDNGTNTCNSGAFETALSCWDGLDTVGEIIARRTSANTPDGTATTIHFRVGVGGSVVQTAGTYTATTTLTALAL